MDKFPHRGYEIRVDDRGYFCFTFAANGESRKYETPTLEEAQTRINKLTAQLLKSRKLNLPVITSKGQGIITGINLHTGNYTGIGLQGEYTIYPFSEKIQRLLSEQSRLRERSRGMHSLLQKYKLDSPRLDRREDYGESFDNLELDYEQKKSRIEHELEP